MCVHVPECVFHFGVFALSGYQPKLFPDENIIL